MSADTIANGLDVFWPLIFGIAVGVAGRFVAAELIARGHPRRLVNPAVIVASVLLIIVSWTAHAILTVL